MLPVDLRNNKIPIQCPQNGVFLWLESRHIWNFLRVQLLLITARIPVQRNDNIIIATAKQIITRTLWLQLCKWRKPGRGGGAVNPANLLLKQCPRVWRAPNSKRQTKTWVFGMPPINYNFVFTALLRNLQFIVLSSTTIIFTQKIKN